MANSLSLCTLLDNDKLYGPNFDSWCQKLKIVLEHEWILYVILDPALEEPASNAPHAIKDTYQKWLNDRTIVCCIMRASMNDKFSQNLRKHSQSRFFKY